MRVLVTNDDGIDSPGLSVLARVAAAAGHEVVVAAPDRQYSGASASLAGHESEEGLLLMSPGRPPGLPEQVESFGVRASPALIVFTASYGAFGSRPDVVLSGINLGANTGHATLHSGTVGAALSAATQDIPAMAVSIASSAPEHWQTAERVCEVTFEWLTTTEVKAGRVLNVNVPDVPLQRLRGLRTARLAEFGAVQASVDAKGAGYVMMTYSDVDAEHEEGTDAYLLAHGWATSSLLRAPIHDVKKATLPEFTTAAAGRDPERVQVSRGQVMADGPDGPEDGGERQP